MKQEEMEARLREQQEKEAETARTAVRDAARAQVQSVEQTVDLDAQLDIMKQNEQSFLDKENGGGASPSSDFGFWGTGGRKTEATSESADHEPHVGCGISHLCVFMYCSLHTAVIRVYHFIFQQ